MFSQQAPEFENIKGWLNTKPLKLSELKGKVVLLDFWTYSCINCLRSLLHIKKIYEKYSKYKFVIIGVHTPEFDFERISSNVAKAVKDLGIMYPVALDSENTTWNLYGNRYWPKQTLIDADGKIKWGHAGEGGYDEIEENIAKLLAENGEKIAIGKEKKVELDFFGISPETYAGSSRNEGIGNGAACIPGRGCDYYSDPGEYDLSIIYLDGAWSQEREYLKHSDNKAGKLFFRYVARNINAVLVPKKKSFEAVIYIDGKYLTKQNAGRDIKFKGKVSYVKVDKPRLYELAKTPEKEEHLLMLETKSKDFRIYAFTFG